jgi:hypothetical protein
MYYRFLILLVLTALTACLQSAPEAPVPTVALVERPAAIDAALEEKIKASVAASLPAGSSASLSDLRIVDYIDLQNNQRWVVCGNAKIVGGPAPGAQIIAYAPHTNIVRFGPGVTKPQEACAPSAN